MGNSGSHDSGAITEYRLLEYTERALYNTQDSKHFHCFKLNLRQVTNCSHTVDLLIKVNASESIKTGCITKNKKYGGT